MGAKNGNAAFQHMIEDLLQRVRDFADPFVDDIIIGLGTEDMTEDELIEADEKDMCQVFGVLDTHSMVCKPTKTSLFVREVEFAGHVCDQVTGNADPLQQSHGRSRRLARERRSECRDTQIVD